MAELDPIDPLETPKTEENVVVAEVIIPEAPALIELPPNRPRKVYAGMWGPLEIGVVAAGALTIMAVAMVYFFWVIPSNNELANNRSEAARLEAEAISAKSKYGEITTTESQVAKIITSVDDFEARYLPVSATGQTALYQRLNGLIHAYGLINTTGPDYAPLETADANIGQQTEEEKGRAKYRSLFPGVYVTTTVEGTYHNLRRFIRELETGREFIVVSAIELAPSDSDQKRNPAEKTNVVSVEPTYGSPNSESGLYMPKVNQPTQAASQESPREKGKTHGEVVTLRIEMAAYFRRPGFSATADQ